MRYFFIIIFLIEYLCSSVVVDDSTKKIDNFTIKYYFDGTKNLTIDDVSKKTFTQDIPNKFTLGYTKGYNWFKIDITNKGDVDNYTIYINEPFFEQADFFFYENGWKHFDSGLTVPLDKRIIKDSNPAFPIVLQKGETKTYYIKTYARLASFGNIIIYQSNELYTHFKLYSIMFYMLYFGGLFVMIIFNLFLFMTIKEKIYLYYVLYAFFYTIYLFVFSGMNIYTGLESWHYKLHTATPLFIIFLILFSMTLLETQKYIPVADKILKILVYFYIIMTILIFKNIVPWFQLLTSISLLVCILLIYAAVSALKNGQIIAKYYLFAISIYMVTMIFFASMVNGWIENNDFNRYAFLIASFLELMFFSFMLANRYNELFRRLTQTESNLRVLNRNLEQKVFERTQDLAVKQQQLISLNNTLEKKVQEAIEETQYKEKLLQEQSKLASMGEMIRNIAHQWRQPLAVANTIVSILKEKNNRNILNQEYTQQKLDEIENNNLYMSQTIEDFLSYFSPRKKQEIFLLLNVVNKSLNIVKNLINKQNIELHVNIESEIEVFGFEDDYLQVILSILTNAIFALQNNIYQKLILNGYVSDDKFVVLDIIDNAGGISSDIIDRIFEPYFTTKHQLNGTGLGLYIAKTIVEQKMAGSLIVENIDNGAKFTIICNRKDNKNVTNK